MMSNLNRLEYLMNRMLGQETEWELDDLHRRLNQAVVNKEGFDAIEALFQECMARPGSDGECMVCGVILCPHHEPLHYHHDGCPACSFDEPEAVPQKGLDNGP
jgi:hypothetical protein